MSSFRNTKLAKKLNNEHYETKEAAKKATKAFSPTPLSLVVMGTFFLTLLVLFSLVAHPFSPPPLLVARPLRKDLFLRLP